MSAAISHRATPLDLAKTEGKAELIAGRIETLMPTGDLPSDVAGNIYISLKLYAKKVSEGVAKPDNTGFLVPELPSGRESFSPDASYYVGPRPTNRLRFITGAPRFAAEVRGENDYGTKAEVKMAEKRADYFAAGTLVVWDVDAKNECVHVYRADDPMQPTTYRRGQDAEAEPAVPGWSIPVDELFDV